MTIINRALDKAYKRHSEAESGTRPESRPPAVRGWASKLRDPLRPIQPPDRIAATLSTVAQGLVPATALPVGTHPPTSSAATAIPHETTARIDSPHAPAKAPAILEIRPEAFLSLHSQTVESQAEESAQTATVPIATAWAWPPIVDKLLNCPAGSELRNFAARLNQFALSRSLGCLAFSGPGRGAGRTSLLLALAHALAEKHAARVAIVDADFQNPQAAQMLSLRPKVGLWEAASRRETVATTVMTLVPGKLAIVPLVAPVASAAIDSEKIATLTSFLQAVRSEYDLLLVDAGPWESLVPPLIFENYTIDAMICVSRHGAAADERLDDDAYRQPGVDWLGIIETFTPVAQMQARSA